MLGIVLLFVLYSGVYGQTSSSDVVRFSFQTYGPHLTDDVWYEYSDNRMRTIVLKLSDPSVLEKRKGVRLQVKVTQLDAFGIDMENPTTPITTPSLISGNVAEVNAYGAVIFPNLMIMMPTGLNSVQYMLMFTITPTPEIANDERNIFMHVVEISPAPSTAPLTRELVFFSILSEAIRDDFITTVAIECGVTAMEIVLSADSTTLAPEATVSSSRNHHALADATTTTSSCVSISRITIALDMPAGATVDRLLLRANNQGNVLQNAFCVVAAYVMPRSAPFAEKFTFAPPKVSAYQTPKPTQGLDFPVVGSDEFLTLVMVLGVPVVVGIVSAVFLCVYRCKLKAKLRKETERSAIAPHDVLANYVVTGAVSPVQVDAWRMELSPTSPTELLEKHRDNDDDDGDGNGETVLDDDDDGVEDTHTDRSEATSRRASGAKLNRLQGHKKDEDSDEDESEESESDDDDTPSL